MVGVGVGFNASCYVRLKVTHFNLPRQGQLLSSEKEFKMVHG